MRILFAAAALGASLLAQTPRSGQAIFESACIGCHGFDGKGAPQSSRGFEPPKTFPDFTDCNGTAREPDADWRAIIHHGGPARGFSEIMPSFTEALRPDEIDRVLQYVRGFCREPRWPRGDLNLPRAIFTEKAFPEDEFVIASYLNTNGTPGLTNDLIYERRFGMRNQLELAVPVGSLKQDSGHWLGGVGDIRIGYKRPLYSSLRAGSIFSLSGEVTLPTGNRERGLGGGTTILETFASYGQILPHDSFLQFQTGLEVPTRTSIANKAFFHRSAFGKSFTDHTGTKPLWSPMVELLADRELATGQKTNWDVVPQMQVTLSRRRHIRASAGYRFPVNNTAGRSSQFIFYLLWDWFDGGLREGWR